MATVTIAPAPLDLGIVRGDDYDLELTFIDVDAVPLPLTGSFAAQLREDADAADPTVTFAIDDSNAAAGVLALSLTGAITAALPSTLVWDLEQTLTGGKKQTLIAGLVRVHKDVTR